MVFHHKYYNIKSGDEQVQHENDNYQHRRHNKNLLMVHLIFMTKYRKPLLKGALKNDIKQYICDACRKQHWYVRRIEADKDHIHILLQYNPADSITEIVSRLKQYSTFWAWKTHGQTLRSHYWTEKTLWSDGYFAASIGMVSKNIIEQYIENQG